MRLDGCSPQPSGGRRRRAVIIFALQLALLVSVLSAPSARAGASLGGFVLDEGGSPVENATVSAWLGDGFIASARTEADGRFELEVEPGARYVVYVFADDGSTPGVDYLPSRAEAAPSDGDLRFTLVEGASLALEGDIQFVESEELPYFVLYSVLDPADDEVMTIGGLSLRYGSAPETLSGVLKLDPSHLIVPADAPFTVEVNASILVGSSSVVRSFKVEPDRRPLKKGELATMDLRGALVQFNLETVDALHRTVESRLAEMEALGFYLTSESVTAASALRELSEARYLHQVGRYTESFDAAKRSYITLRQTMKILVGLYRDAALSVYILIFFLGFTSVAIAFLSSNRESTKLLGSSVIYAAALAALYLTYPGSAIVPVETFAGSAALALMASLFMAGFLPRLMKGRGADDHVPVRNIIVPIFSMAKRSIRRRRLRFALTLISLTVLVMSFVTLTSFSEGYGLIVSCVSRRGTPAKAVLLRDQGYTEFEPSFMVLTDVGLGWLERQPESGVVAPKAENLPSPQPLARLNGAPILGVVGIDPDVEGGVIDLGAALSVGSLPSEGTVLISEALRRDLGVEVGDTVVLGGVAVELAGVLDDEEFGRLRELDTSTYLPKKLVNINPEGEAPYFVVEPCEPREVVVTHLSTALEMPFVGVVRVAVAVEEDVDVNAFAERLALERGYRAWASSEEGVYSVHLGSYLEGKGLPLMVPWGIVVLNVVVTMLNSMYERRREVHILSSVGLNPAQIAAIFFAEASIIGITAGGVGYLAGLGLYRAMALSKLALEVHQKVSAFWSLAAIGI
ncbi:MAG: FtsX-like permease family protein, partial [Candidatus Bathyarchaeia archaeon]